MKKFPKTCNMRCVIVNTDYTSKHVHLSNDIIIAIATNIKNKSTSYVGYLTMNKRVSRVNWWDYSDGYDGISLAEAEKRYKMLIKVLDD